MFVDSSLRLELPRRTGEDRGSMGVEDGKRGDGPPESEPKRRETRLPTSLTVLVRSTARRCYGTLYDLSPSGAFLALDAPPGAGARLQVVLRLADRTDLVLDAEVRYSTSDLSAKLSDGVGIQFTDLSDAQREAIHAIVDRLRAGKRPRGETPADEDE